MYLILCDLNPDPVFLLHVYTHPVVTTISSTINRPTRAPATGIAVFERTICIIDVHVSEADECVGGG